METPAYGRTPSKKPGKTLVRIYRETESPTDPSVLYRRALLWARILWIVLAASCLLLLALHLGGVI